MKPEEWIEEFARRLGVEAPDPTTVEALLDLAGTAAHESGRVAAPIACYLVGRAGLDVGDAQALADAVGGT
jgi:hypothetical protein